VSTPHYEAATTAIHAAMVDAFGPHITARLAAVDVEPADVADAIAMGRRWLEGRYREQRELPATEQTRSPLELFQAACAFPTERLEALGVEPAHRDDVAVSALPGDVYDLAPASSQDLGDDVWRLHVAWGVARAAVIAGVVPRTDAVPEHSHVGVAVVTGNLMDRTRIVDTAADRGLGSVAWRNPGAVATGLETTVPAVAFVDLEHRAADEVVRLFAGAGIRTIAYGPHVDDFAMARARSLGADDVVTRSRLFGRLTDWMPRPV